jgi:hypothetical protein
MRDVELTHSQRRLIIRFLMLQLMVLGLILLTVLLSSWQTRSDQAVNARAGCERSKLDRNANAAGWRTAQRRLQSQYDRDPQPTDLRALRRYRRIAQGLERRARVECAVAFPDPPFIKLFGVT